MPCVIVDALLAQLLDDRGLFRKTCIGEYGVASAAAPLGHGAWVFVGLPEALDVGSTRIGPKKSLCRPLQGNAGAKFDVSLRRTMAASKTEYCDDSQRSVA
jgi:hypothetical protein